MASGTLAEVDIDGATNAINTNITAYTVPASTLSTFSIVVCNRNSTSATFRIAINGGGSLANGGYIAYDKTILGNETLEYSGRMCEAAGIVTVRSDTTNLTFFIDGFEVSA